VLGDNVGIGLKISAAGVGVINTVATRNSFNRNAVGGVEVTAGGPSVAFATVCDNAFPLNLRCALTAPGRLSMRAQTRVHRSFR